MSCQKMTGAICIEIRYIRSLDEEIFRELYPRNGKAEYADKEGGVHPHFYGYGKTYVAWSRVSSDKADRLDDSNEDNSLLGRSANRPYDVV